MHIYNAWLPAPVVEQLNEEDCLLGEIVQNLQNTWKAEDLGSRFRTLPEISVINNLMRSKTKLTNSDLSALAKIGLDIFFHSSDNLFLQIRWASCLAKLLKKYRKQIDLEVQWRPFYDLLLTAHFKRRDSFDGIGLQQIHLDTVTSLIISCRRFFYPGSTAEIWSEFSPYLKDLHDHSCLEAIGFISLFLPTNAREPDVRFMNSDWLRECLRLWDTVSDSAFWDRQWASLFGRIIKDRAFASPIDWEPFLPSLFAHFLQAFEVPVASSDSIPPFEREVPYKVNLAFKSSCSPTPKVVAKGIVYLLKPDGSAQIFFERLVDLLEQYYHPSNGGSWTSSLEQFLRHLCYFFFKRLSYEEKGGVSKDEVCLRPSDRIRLVKSVMRLIERGQYSKSGRLAVTASNVASLFAFVAPSDVLPFVVSRFAAAIDTLTATHQLEAALRTLALASRGILLASGVEESSGISNELVDEVDGKLDSAYSMSFVDCKATIADAMFTTLLGMDANDPPKTLATFQFYGSILSSVETIGDMDDGGSDTLAIDWSQWLDEFLSRLFVLFVHVESNTQTGELNVSERAHLGSSTFLMQDQSLYSTVIELLFGKMTKTLYHQGLKKVANFVHNNTVPGAVTEIGLMCSALVYSNAPDAISQLVSPIMTSVLDALIDAPSTGFGNYGCSGLQPEIQANLSPATETSVTFKLTLLSTCLMAAGTSLVEYQDILKKVLSAAFNATSLKVNEAGDRVLSSSLNGLLLYYPTDQYRSQANCSGGGNGVEPWISAQDIDSCASDDGLKWHIPVKSEIDFAEDLLTLHLRHSLEDLKNLCKPGHGETSGQNKERFRVLLLRINGSLRGIRSCLPDFSRTEQPDTSKKARIVGKAGASVGSSQLREETAEILHKACEYFLNEKADGTSLLQLLVRALDFVVNYGSNEYNEWSNGRHAWRIYARNLVEPRTNFITGVHSSGKRRPKWMIAEMVYLHNLWRASQAEYRRLDNRPVSLHVTTVSMDLLKLSLHNYTDVRGLAASSLKKIMKRYPSVVKICMPVLTTSLQDPTSLEHSALGACSLLVSRPVLRHIVKDWSGLASLIMAILGSAHHETVKSQTAISELAIAFSVRYSGIPVNAYSFESKGNVLSYDDLLAYITNGLEGKDGPIHWRYALMAHVGLFCLVPPNESFHDAEKVLQSRKLITGRFLDSLRSELPPLRPLAVIALLLLLQGSSYKIKAAAAPMDTDNAGSTKISISMEDVLTSALKEPSFTETMVKNLAVDHNYPEEHGRTGGGRSRMGSSSELSLTAVMPSFVKGWPRTRNWVAGLKGEGFSSKFAKLFKRMVQEAGPVMLTAIRSPLQEAVNAIEERGMQCVGAEIFAGLLHSDVACVVEAWDDGWLSSLFYKAIMQSNVESSSEWAACIRFAVSGKGSKGTEAPLMRNKILDCIIKPLPPSSLSSLITKRLDYLLAGIVELSPFTSSTHELAFQLNLLKEVMDYTAHQSYQVRQCVGKILLAVGTNLQQAKSSGMISDTSVLPDWENFLVDGARSATANIQNSLDNGSSVESSENGSSTESAAYMETILQLVLSGVISGRSTQIMNVCVKMLPLILSLQETSHKELSTIAKLTIYILKWQPFRDEYESKAVAAIISAANDNNWRTRTAALSFVQSFFYRHTFMLKGGDIESLWNCVEKLLCDPQLEVRELASTTLSGMMKSVDNKLLMSFHAKLLTSAMPTRNKKKRRERDDDKVAKHGVVLGLKACILSAPYDIPRWMPEMIMILARYMHEASAISSSVTKTIAEFRRTHADTWAYQKSFFSQEQLEVLSDLSSSASYFA